MTRHLLAGEGALAGVTDAAVAAARAAGAPFWLDLVASDAADHALLHDALGLSDPALAEAERAGRRPAFDDHEGFVVVVAYGAAERPGALAEVHCLATERFLVTVRPEPLPALDELRGRLGGGACAPPPLLLLRLLNALVDSLVPLVTDVDARADELADRVLEEGGEDVQREILEIRRRLIPLRRVLIPQRDALGRLASAEPGELPGARREDVRRFRGPYERMVRLCDALDGAREAAQAATDVHLGTVNNRLNVVMKQLTAIAGIFLPISFLTGFFGQNFTWMVDRVGGLPAFLALGVGLQVAVVVALFALFRRRGWL